MCLRDVRGDMQAKAQSLSAVPYVAAEERLEKPFHRRLRDWIAGVRHPKFEDAVTCSGSDAHRLVVGSVRQRVADEVADQLSDAFSVAQDRVGYIETGFNQAPGGGRPQ